ncbi:hypothetical protein MHBO_000983 [Bonamia ostreae]|uniref:Uncharacterized protein n=1 Tax=Bonamia ostreae TaxID=126728 RepID=A0ABV2AIB7_9EUKA
MLKLIKFRVNGGTNAFKILNNSVRSKTNQRMLKARLDAKKRLKLRARLNSKKKKQSRIDKLSSIRPDEMTMRQMYRELAYKKCWPIKGLLDKAQLSNLVKSRRITEKKEQEKLKMRQNKNAEKLLKERKLGYYLYLKRKRTV